MYALEILNEDAPTVIPMNDMKIGEIGVVEKSKNFNGHIVLKHYQGVVSLTDPENTWDSDTSLSVRLLPNETVIQITI